MFIEGISRKKWAKTSAERLLEKITSNWRDKTPKRYWPSAMIGSLVRISENIEFVMKVLCKPIKVRTKLKGKRAFYGRPFGALQSAMLG